MPRIEAESTELDPENGATASRLTFGVKLVSEWMSVIPLSCSCSVVKAVTAIGTCWMFSDRFSAVTTTSCSVSATAGAEVAGGAACCARAGAAAAISSRTDDTEPARRA